MSLHAHSLEPIPEATMRIARAAFPKGTLCLRLRDALGTIYTPVIVRDCSSFLERKISRNSPDVFLA